MFPPPVRKYPRQAATASFCFLLASIMSVVPVISCGTASAGHTTPSTISTSGGTPPLPALTLAATPLAGDTPLPVTFAATCSTCVTYTWSFGDGPSQTVSGPSQTHVYQNTGTYSASVAATDEFGSPAVGTVVVTVNSQVVLSQDTRYCNPDGSWIGPANDGPATLPRICQNTPLANTPATGAVVNVNANDANDLQNKLTAA